MKMERNDLKELLKMEKKMDSLLGGIKMERKSMKELKVRVKNFLLKSGMKMAQLRNDDDKVY
jgi:hypothetical protein